eukprot:scaffold88768_cov81-Phaeocystis_antarctica.AAC.1
MGARMRSAPLADQLGFFTARRAMIARRIVRSAAVAPRRSLPGSESLASALLTPRSLRRRLPLRLALGLLLRLRQPVALWARASAPTPPSRTPRGAAASATSSADSPPPAARRA